MHITAIIYGKTIARNFQFNSKFSTIIKAMEIKVWLNGKKLRKY